MNAAVVWIVGGIGVLLVYSAYKHKSPLTVVTGVIGGG